MFLGGLRPGGLRPGGLGLGGLRPWGIEPTWLRPRWNEAMVDWAQTIEVKKIALSKWHFLCHVCHSPDRSPLQFVIFFISAHFLAELSLCTNSWYFNLGMSLCSISALITVNLWMAMSFFSPWKMVHMLECDARRSTLREWCHPSVQLGVFGALLIASWKWFHSSRGNRAGLFLCRIGPWMYVDLKYAKSLSMGSSSGKESLKLSNTFSTPSGGIKARAVMHLLQWVQNPVRVWEGQFQLWTL